MERNKQNLRFFYGIEVCIMLAGLVFLFWRAPYGYCYNDEPFIVTLGQRLYMGDSLLFDEWHLTQSFSPVMLIFYGLFRLFHDSNEGILLTFRFVFCALWFASCFAVYYVLRKKYRFAILPFVYLLLFAPYDYMTLSYKSLGLMSCMLLAAFLFNRGIKNSFRLSVLPFSLLWCVLVMSSPLMAAVYFFYIAAVILYRILKAKNKLPKTIKDVPVYLDLRFAVVTTAVIAVIALFVLTPFLWRAGFQAGFSGLIDNIRCMLQDPEHSTSAVRRILTSVKELFHSNTLYSCILIFSVLCGISKNRFRFLKPLGFLLLTGCFVFAVVSHITSGLSTFNFEMINIAMFGVAAFFLLNKKPAGLFCSFTLMGSFYTIFQGLSSNCGMMEICMSVVPIGVSGIVFIILLAKELFSSRTEPGTWDEEKKNRHAIPKKAIIYTLTVLIFSVQVCSQLHFRFSRQFFDQPVSGLTQTIGVGAAKGLKTTPENKETYENTYRQLKSLIERAGIENDPAVLFASFSSDPIVYLDADLPFGTFSTWTFGYENSAKLYERFKTFYERNPEKQANVFFSKWDDTIPEQFETDAYQVYREGSAFLFVANTLR